MHWACRLTWYTAPVSVTVLLPVLVWQEVRMSLPQSRWREDWGLLPLVVHTDKRVHWPLSKTCNSVLSAEKQL